MEVSGQLHASAVLFPGNDDGTYYMGDWVGSRADLDISEKVKITAFDRIRFPGHTYHQHHYRFVLYSAFVRHISRVCYLDVMLVLDSDFKAQGIVLFRRFCKSANSDS